MNTRRWIFAIVAVSVLSGCTHAIPLRPTLEPPPAVQRAPVAVGLYTPPEFRDYHHKASKFGDTWDFGLGAVSVDLVHRALGLLFESVQPVAARPPQPGMPTVAGVLEPRIEAFDFGLPLIKTGNYTAEITYRFTLLSMAGAPLGSWTVQGSGSKAGQVGFEFARWPGEAADLAMQDAMHEFVRDFHTVPEVSRWLESAGVRSVAASAPSAARTMAPTAPPATARAAPSAREATVGAGLRALVGSWTGTLVAPLGQVYLGIRREQPVSVQILERDGRIEWSLRGGWPEGSLSGQGQAQIVDSDITLAGSQQWGGGSPAPVRYSMSRKPGSLEGTVVGPDNRVYAITLQRAP